MKKWSIVLSLPLLFLSGCTTAVIVGGATAASVVAITSDYVTTSIDIEFNQAWRVAKNQLAILGELDESEQKLGELEAVVDKAKVKVNISKLTEETVDIRVAARRELIPDVDLARSILANIIRNL